MKTASMLPELLAQGATIVDVRSPEEYLAGANPVSVNIPLDQVAHKISSLDKTKTVILCCASGARSGMAVSIFKQHGFEKVYNAGAWQNTLKK